LNATIKNSSRIGLNLIVSNTKDPHSALLRVAQGRLRNTKEKGRSRKTETLTADDRDETHQESRPEKENLILLKARRKTNLHRIVLILKSSGADSSVLTWAFHKIVNGNDVRTLGTACGIPPFAKAAKDGASA